MAWLKTLADTYDVFSGLAGVEKNGQPILLPIAHSTFNAQIEVTIDHDGVFVGARKLDKGEDVITIIPVTKDSMAKANGITPHPLCDQLCYLAGDYTRYTGEPKEKYFEAYMKQLKEWVESEYTHPMIKAIYQYLEKKTLITDLVSSMALETDSDGRLTDQVKIHGLGQTGANVRFIVRGCEVPAEAWKNRKLYQLYSDYYRQRAGELDLCYVTGEKETCSDKHPSKIRNTADKAKLISGNDETGFTYRGRFTSKEQAVAVGYDTSQKAHNALRWLIQKQGYTRDDSAIVCWMTNRDMQLPDMMKNSINACNEIEDFDFDFDLIESDETHEINKPDTGKYFAEKFNMAMNGYLSKFEIADGIAIIALDAATTGRLSVVYYDEMGGKQYADAILNWQRHCKWRRKVKIEKSLEENRYITCECTPSPRDMALAAYGTQRSEWLEADGKLLKATVKRLLPCITRKGTEIPKDLIRAAARRAAMPQAMSDYVWNNNVLCVVCAMIRFNYEIKEGRTMERFLDDNMNDRNVLFGRLLAVYDYMEQRAMYEFGEDGKRKETRATNAKRYWNAYSSRPAATAKTIGQNLIAYERRLSAFERMKFENWMEEIMTQFAPKEYDNRTLSEMYLPAYYQQMEYMKQAFRKKEGGQEDE